MTKNHTCTAVENSKRRRAAERRGSGARPAAQRPGGRCDDVGFRPPRGRRAAQRPGGRRDDVGHPPGSLALRFITRTGLGTGD